MGRWWCAGPPPAWRSPPANSAESKATENSQFSLRNLLELPTISLSKVVRLPSQVAGSPPKFHGDRDILERFHRSSRLEGPLEAALEAPRRDRAAALTVTIRL